jgi:RHS repeat-associated protein
MPGRQFNSNAYLYGMNGQEKDNEITGNAGTHMSAEYWEYDTRIGRRWNRDPITYSWQSPYACFNNNPIYFADPSGLEGGPAKKDPEFTGFNTGGHRGVEGDPLQAPEVTICGNCDGEAGGKAGGTANSHGGNGEGNHLPPLLAVSTVNASKPVPPPHVAFTVEAVSIGGGHIVGGEGTIKRFDAVSYSSRINYLYPEQSETFTALEFDLKAGIVGGGASATAGDGYLTHPDPWKRISDDILDISDYDKSVTYGFLTVSTTDEVTLGVSRLHYTMMGVSIGSEVKVESPFDVGAGFNTTILSNVKKGKSISDSAVTADAFPNHTISQSFHRRHPRKN